TEVRPVSGVVKSDGQSLSIDAIKGNIGGGEFTADIDAQPALAGFAVGARLQWANVDGAALRYRSLVLPAGKTSLKMTLASQGRSASALEGALSGNGLLTIESARIAGLDPRAFEIAMRASDTAVATDDAKLRQIVEPALNAGALAVASAQIPFVIKDARLRVGATTLEADGARAIVSGGYDIAADQADLRASLMGTATGSSSVRPEIQVFAAGSPDRLDRTVDVASLSSWLAVRAIDRETKRLDALERGDPPAAAQPAATPPAAAPAETAPEPPRRTAPKLTAPRAAIVPAPTPVPAPAPVARPQLAPLPAPIEIRPAPRPRQAPPLVLTPPAATLSRPAL
ncbi:MAG: hypothetical protein JWR80_8664, partial [Bradyrhizobium sp.]|nr:hypothetical protein [Bradyrhizobium sp.]